jgi:hypothetical protein
MAGASALPFMPVSAPLVVGVDLASEPSRTIAARWIVESTPGAGGSWVYRFFVDDEAPAEFVWLLDPSPPTASETKG